MSLAPLNLQCNHTWIVNHNGMPSCGDCGKDFPPVQTEKVKRRKWGEPIPKASCTHEKRGAYCPTDPEDTREICLQCNKIIH